MGFFLRPAHIEDSVIFFFPSSAKWDFESHLEAWDVLGSVLLKAF